MGLALLLHRFVETAERHFAWKVRQRKRYDRNPLLVTFQDKYAAKLYAGERGVKSAELLWVGDEAAALPFGQLPPDYFVKATHGRNWNIRCSDSELYLYRDGADMVHTSLGGSSLPTQQLSRRACVATCQEWLSRVYSASEWAYTEINPRLVVEAPLIPRDGDQLLDYRLYTFGGEVKAIGVGSPLYRKNRLNVFFTPEWEEITLTRYTEAPPSPRPKKPDTLAEMISIAETLGSRTDFVRVDLYDTVQGVMLGELTAYPYAGRVGTPTGCRAFNRWLGQQWRLAPYQGAPHYRQSSNRRFLFRT